MLDREELGKLVRETWIKYRVSIGDKKLTHLIKWEFLTENEREVDRKIGEAIQNKVISIIKEVVNNAKVLVSKEDDGHSNFNYCWFSLMDKLKDIF